MLPSESWLLFVCESKTMVLHILDLQRQIHLQSKQANGMNIGLHCGLTYTHIKEIDMS